MHYSPGWGREETKDKRKTTDFTPCFGKNIIKNHHKNSLSLQEFKHYNNMQTENKKTFYLPYDPTSLPRGIHVLMCVLLRHIYIYIFYFIYSNTFSYTITVLILHILFYHLLFLLCVSQTFPCLSYTSSLFLIIV